MNRIQRMALLFLSTLAGAFVVGSIIGAIGYPFWHSGRFELTSLVRDAVATGVRLGQLFGPMVFFTCLSQYVCFSEPLADDEKIASAAMGISSTFVVLSPAPISVLLFLASVGWLTWLVWQKWKSSPKPEPVGIIVATKRNGLPALEWSQLVTTNDTLASENARGRFKLYLGFVATCAVIGWATGGFEEMIFFGIMSAWLGAFGLRGAGALKMQGQTLAAVPHVKTETERREEVIPVTMREDCQAYLEVADNQIWFCIDRGDKTKGPLTLAERVPWESFSNFEEGSHKQWFRGRGSVSDLADWGVIVAQSSVGRVVMVAESVYEQAWLVELLVTLQHTFVAPRDVMIRQMREAQQLRERAQRKSSDPGSSDSGAVPKRSF